MESLSAIKDIYIVCGAVGAFYFALSIAMGHVGHGEHTGSDGHIDGGHAGADAHGHSGADPVDGGHGHGANTHSHQIKAILVEEPRGGAQAARFLVGLLSPTKIAMFLATFGFCGLILVTALPVLHGWSLPIAALLSCMITGRLLSLFNWLLFKAHVSSAARVTDMVGQIAEVSIPVKDGRVGEIIYVTDSGRHNFAAKSNQTGLQFSSGDKVMIADVRNRVAYIEPWTDIVLEEPQFSEEIINVKEKEAG